MYPFLTYHRNKTFVRIFNNFVDVTTFKVHSHTIAFCFSEIQQLIDEVVQSIGILRHYVKIFLYTFIIYFFTVDDVLKRSFDKGERCANFVRNIRKEIDFALI